MLAAISSSILSLWQGKGILSIPTKRMRAPCPAFEGEPRKISIPENIEDFANAIWANLNTDNKVSLFIRTIDLATGETEDTIYNGYDAVCQE